MFVEFISCTAAQTHELRQKILRPHQSVDEMVYEGDDTPGTYHCSAIVDGTIVGVASIYMQDLPGQKAGVGWRVRGMAVLDEYRGRNYGLHILGNCLSHAKVKGGEYTWCNARKEAFLFYEKEGFEADGEEFEMEGIGTHQLMIRFFSL